MIVIWVVGMITLIIFVLMIMDLLLLHQSRMKANEIEKSETRKTFQKEIQRINTEVSIETLNKVGWEMHDNWGQILTITSMMLSKENSTDSEKQNIMNEARENILKVVAYIRGLNQVFRNMKNTNVTLFEHLEQLHQMNEKSGILKSELHLSGNPELTDSNTNIILTRITQELMNNSAKHGDAKLCTIIVDIQADKLFYTYRDDGVGFKYDNTRTFNGNGLANIQSRLQLLNSDFTIQSSPGKGFEFSSIVPVANTMNT